MEDYAAIGLDEVTFSAQGAPLTEIKLQILKKKADPVAAGQAPVADLLRTSKDLGPGETSKVRRLLERPAAAVKTPWL